MQFCTEQAQGLRRRTFKIPNLKRVSANECAAHKFLRVKISRETCKCAPRFTSSNWTKIGRNRECKVPGRNPRSEKIPLFKNSWMRSTLEEFNFPTTI
jgi:hypothetical protein